MPNGAERERIDEQEVMGWQPWTVRHIHTAVDHDFDQYLTTMRTLLDQAEQARWASPVTHIPVATASDVAHALSEPLPDELVIVDLHGDTDEDGAWLGPLPDQPFFNLREVESGSWAVAALVLTGCRGAQEPFRTQLRRINTRPFAQVGHWETSKMGDHTAVDLVTAILREAQGGDDYGACTAAINALRERHAWNGEPWMSEHLKP